MRPRTAAALTAIALLPLSACFGGSASTAYRRYAAGLDLLRDRLGARKGVISQQ